MRNILTAEKRKDRLCYSVVMMSSSWKIWKETDTAYFCPWHKYYNMSALALCWNGHYSPPRLVFLGLPPKSSHLTSANMGSLAAQSLIESTFTVHSLSVNTMSPGNKTLSGAKPTKAMTMAVFLCLIYSLRRSIFVPHCWILTDARAGALWVSENIILERYWVVV